MELLTHLSFFVTTISRLPTAFLVASGAAAVNYDADRSDLSSDIDVGLRVMGTPYLCLTQCQMLPNDRIDSI